MAETRMDTKASQGSLRKKYETPRLRQYGSLIDIVLMKGVAGAFDALSGLNTKQTAGS